MQEYISYYPIVTRTHLNNIKAIIQVGAGIIECRQKLVKHNLVSTQE